MASPIVLLSGCVGFGEEYTRVEGYSNRDVGAVVLKGTTGEARLGNPPHRVYETPMGMLNAIGLQNPGVDAVVLDILPGLDFSETRFFANVSGSTIEEYERVTRGFDDSPIDAIEINISCPNVKEGGVQFGNDPDMSARVVAACRAVTSKPIITKLSPNQTDIRENARRCIEAGTDGFAVINTITGMAVDTRTATNLGFGFSAGFSTCANSEQGRQISVRHTNRRFMRVSPDKRIVSTIAYITRTKSRLTLWNTASHT
jgi:dihydroorotate dehydrogenase (NAD+) catalytic subunit